MSTNDHVHQEINLLWLHIINAEIIYPTNFKIRTKHFFSLHWIHTCSFRDTNEQVFFFYSWFKNYEYERSCAPRYHFVVAIMYIEIIIFFKSSCFCLGFDPLLHSNRSMFSGVLVRTCWNWFRTYTNILWFSFWWCPCGTLLKEDEIVLMN